MLMVILVLIAQAMWVLITIFIRVGASATANHRSSFRRYLELGTKLANSLLTKSNEFDTIVKDLWLKKSIAQNVFAVVAGDFNTT